MKVQDICSREAVHIPLSCTLQEAAVQFRDRHVGALVVTEHTATGARAVGFVTDRDMALDAVAAGADPCRTTVDEVMTRGLVTVRQDASVSDAMQTMLSHGVRRLAVLDGEAVIGVLSIDDVVETLASELRMLSTLLHNEREREKTGAVQGKLPT
ncbi:signal transduction protein (plasmid) [Cupriavidus sp. USMAHM13]|uniref:CBS domain-containing protein n=1 Tax=Cupriavidus sp. USMAHM13 TaxID=1389192 RepID=UPI0008A6C7A6|nr:CBS domain-containing protein [Cupriavidus sp. USMAHM13]AOZ04291.1 signal transduction protein [Cupriavidus sp. USMAHM13]